MNWQYDGSFAGWLATCFRVYEAHDHHAVICPAPSADGLFAGELSAAEMPLASHDQDSVVLSANRELAGRVYRGLARTGGNEAAWLLRDAFLNREPDAGNHLLGYVRIVMRSGQAALQMLADPAIHEVDRRARAVRREAHRFQGFLRFHQIDQDGPLLYAAFRPDHDILPLLLPHFRDRMGERDWMIHDIGRKQAAVFRQGQLDMLANISTEGELPESADEDAFQQLWQGYFRNIAIPERRNPKLQRSFLPKKYWDLLVEEPGTSTRSVG